MKPYLEKLPSSSDSSLSLLNRRLDDGIPFLWHHHPEFELTLTLNSVGQRFIGDHVGDYADGDLVLIGPNLPHTWASRERLDGGQPHTALVTWFHPDWARRATDGFVEFAGIEALLAKAGRGVVFSAGAARAVRGAVEWLFEAAPTERLLGLFAVLNDLAGDEGARPLSSVAALPVDEGQSRERIDRVLTHIHANYARSLPMAELASVGALSVSGLHRLFVRHTGVAVSDYLIRMRIGDACARLSGTAQPIGFVADAVGYASLANFNRQFKGLKGMTPREYRARFVR